MNNTSQTQAVSSATKLIAMLGLFLALLFPIAASAEYKKQFMLEGVGDGDTIYVRAIDGKSSQRVRLAMIDAPEKNQDYGQDSKSALVQLLRGADKLDITVFGYDRYNRMIGMVERNGRNINLAMVEQGAAWLYTQYAQKPAFAAYLPSFENALRSAQTRRMGIWGTNDPVAPWKYRRG